MKSINCKFVPSYNFAEFENSETFCIKINILGEIHA
jgi:hypothetical protein